MSPYYISKNMLLYAYLSEKQIFFSAFFFFYIRKKFFWKQ